MNGFDDRDMLDQFDDADIFFDDFLLSDFTNVDSFLDEGGASIKSSSELDQSSVLRRQQVKKSKLKKRKFDEIAADDPRKQYTDLTVAAIGLGDEKKIREVFEEHYTGDCIFVVRFTKDTPELPNHREIHGREKMVEFIMNVIEICPDCVLRVEGRQLNIYKDGSSYLVAKLNFAGSWLSIAPLQLFEHFEIPHITPSTNNHNDTTINNNEKTPGTASTTTAEAAEVSTESINMTTSAPTTTTAKPRRRRIHIAVSNVSHINAQGQVFKVDTYMKADIADDADSSDSEDD